MRNRFSPRMWRCFQKAIDYSNLLIIFSTYVEVFLRHLKPRVLPKDFLHVCGGVSQTPLSLKVTVKFSPRMWRCFHSYRPRINCVPIFSTYVEVFLLATSATYQGVDFLHVCGGVSLDALNEIGSVLFSPRMWRCFLSQTKRRGT